jgi:hypothetical protein
MSWASDKLWSDAYMPAVCNIVGPMLLEPAPLIRDQTEATDLIVLRARDMTIAVRIRREGYAGRYPGQFTVRSKRDSGAETELAKIIKGWGDWFFYGHASGQCGISEWIVIDLHGLRQSFQLVPSILHNPDNLVSGLKANHDGTHFRWFQADRLPDYVTKARSTQRQHLLSADAA